jgi:hypothetical protein
MKIKKNIALSDSGFLFNPTSGDSYSVNETGGLIINLIKKGDSDEKIIKKITDEYIIDPSSAEKDYYDFIKMLQTYKLLQDNE